MEIVRRYNTDDDLWVELLGKACPMGAYKLEAWQVMEKYPRQLREYVSRVYHREIAYGVLDYYALVGKRLTDGPYVVSPEELRREEDRLNLGLEWFGALYFRQKIEVLQTQLQKAAGLFDLAVISNLIGLIYNHFGWRFSLCGALEREEVREQARLVENYCYDHGTSELAACGKYLKIVMDDMSVSEGLRGLFFLDQRQIIALGAVRQGRAVERAVMIASAPSRRDEQECWRRGPAGLIIFR